MTLSAKEAKGIENWSGLLKNDITIRLLRTEDERTRELEAFCDGLERLADRVHVEYAKADDRIYPAMELLPGLLYQGVPHGAELSPFLEILGMIGDNRPEDMELLLPRVKAVAQPAQFTLYVTTHCPSCPVMVRQLALLPITNPLLGLTIVEGEMFPEPARVDRVQAVPTAILDNGFRWTAVTPLDEILDVIEKRDASDLGAKAMKRMIKEGGAERLAALMAEAGAVAPELADLVAHPEWSTRLGAMVVVEELNDLRPELVQGLLPALWDRLPHAEVPAQGDVVALVGQMGDPEWIGPLKRLMEETQSEELKEVIAEVIEELQVRVN